jgi:ribosomal protein S7
MVKTHVSELRYRVLSKYDSISTSRKNKYTMLFLFFYKDYFLYKLLNKLMRNGNKYIALSILRQSLFILKQYIGFQPFFLFKHVSFRMRQLYKIEKKTVRRRNMDKESKVYYRPLSLMPHNQIAYGINNLIICAKQLVRDEKQHMSKALSIVFLNSFISAL